MKLSPLTKSVMIGLSIATVTSSFVLPMFVFIGMDRTKMMAVLYLYYVVGGLSGYLSYRFLTKKVKVVDPGGNKENIINEVPPKPVENASKPQKEQNPIDPTVYKQTLDKIANLKKTSIILKGLIETRKNLEELKKESNNIVEETVEKMNNKSVELSKNYYRGS